MSPLERTPPSIEHALLGYLREGPLHGYEIHRRLAGPEGLGRVWRLKQSHLYSLLGRLEEAGYVASRREEQATRPARKVFSLTDAGRAAYRAWVQSPVAHGRELRLDFLAKLYFARQEGPEVAARLVAAQRQALEAWRAAQHAEAEAARRRDHYEWLVCQFRLGQIDAMLGWLEECDRLGQAA